MSPAGVVRSLIAGMFIVLDVVLAWLWLSVLQNTPRLQSVIVASIATLAVGACCLVAVIVLSIQWRTPVAATRPNRNTATTVLSGVAALHLVAGFVAMALAGGFTDLFASEVLIGTMIPAVATVLLSVSVARHVARTAAGATG